MLQKLVNFGTHTAEISRLLFIHSMQCSHGARGIRSQLPEFLLIHELVPTIFELTAPLPTKVFADFMVQHLMLFPS